MSIFNEVAVTLYLYLLIGLTEYNETRAMKDSIGNALLYLVLLTVFVNALAALIPAVKKAIELIRRILSRLKMKLRKESTVKIIPKEPAQLKP